MENVSVKDLLQQLVKAVEQENSVNSPVCDEQFFRSLLNPARVYDCVEDAICLHGFNDLVDMDESFHGISFEVDWTPRGNQFEIRLDDPGEIAYDERALRRLCETIADDLAKRLARAVAEELAAQSANNQDQ